MSAEKLWEAQAEGADVKYTVTEGSRSRYEATARAWPRHWTDIDIQHLLRDLLF